MEEFITVFNIYLKYLDLVLSSAWVWLPFVLSILFFESWMYYIQRFYWKNLEWVQLEIKPPKEIEKTPKNMEQIFAGLWGSFGTIGYKYQKYIQGVIQDYFSCEIVGINGEIHFYIRTPKKFRNLVESLVYAEYPQAEVKEVEDYAMKLPFDIPSQKWDMWGTKLMLDKGNAYPIRTYIHLIDPAKTDEPFVDPLASLMEIMGKLRQGEQIWIQILIRPVADDWRWEAIGLANALIGKKVPPPPEGYIKKEVRTWWEATREVFYEFVLDRKAPPLPVAPGADPNAPPSLAQYLSPGEKDIVQGIEEKASKKGFQCKVQWAYISRREVFNAGNIGSVMGTFNQFANLNMNGFRPEGRTITKAYYILAKMRKAYKQRVLLRLLRSRTFWEPGYILNIEELATIFHFPTVAVKAPMTPYVEIKKSGPPIDLPLE